MKIQTTNKMRKVTSLLALSGLIAACDKSDRSFSILSESDSFQQSSAFSQRTIDVLWVIDNSGSMRSSQANLRTNMRAFIDKFSTLGMDYRMAVTTTDAWLGDAELPIRYPNPLDLIWEYSSYNPVRAQYRQGCTTTDCLGITGIQIMDPSNTVDASGNPTSVFLNNIAVGTTGNGDERAFSSILSAVRAPSNANLGFPRPGSFVSIIFLSDEDDFSGEATQSDHNNPSRAGASYVGDHNYNAPIPLLQPVDYYVNQLDQQFKGHSNYSVSGIFIKDTSCATTLGIPVATRYAEIIEKTSGVAGSICDPQFYTALTSIGQNVLTLASTFNLSRLPIPESIRAVVDGRVIPNNSANGWVYLAEQNAVQFRGSEIPAQGANIAITFDPLTAKN